MIDYEEVLTKSWEHAMRMLAREFRHGFETGYHGRYMELKPRMSDTFVISFPLQPLEGSDIFADSRLRWFGVFLLVLTAFLLNMPETFYAIL